MFPPLMKLAQMYRCLADDTRLRLLHVLTRGPLCVCHFQAILRARQAGISKQLACLRAAGLVTARRHGKWMIYQLPAEPSPELRWQLSGLRRCAARHPVFHADLRRLKKIRRACGWVKQAARAASPAACCPAP